MQEQGKAEAQRVAKLRELGIAADPRPAMDLAQANRAVEVLMSAGVTGVMSAVSNELSGADGIESGPRAARFQEKSRACGAMIDLKWAMIAAAGVTWLAIAFGWVTIPALLLESLKVGFGVSYGLHLGAVERFLDKNC